MSEPPDPHALARRFVTLWQEQLLAIAADPAMAEATARWLTLFAPALAGAAPARPWQPRNDGTAPAAPTSATHGPAAAAGPPRPGGDDLDQLARRLAALEERLAALESGVRRPDRRPRRAAPRRRP